MARRHGDNWYVAGLNGTDRAMTMELSLDQFFTSADQLYIINDQPRKKDQLVPDAARKALKSNGKGKVKITMQPMGGFIIAKE